MNLEIFAVFDSAAAAFLPPWTVPTRAMALRALSELPESQPAHEFVRHAEHYTLFQVGTFDATSGVIKPCAPEAVSNLKVLFARVKVSEKPSVVALRERQDEVDRDLVMERAS